MDFASLPLFQALSRKMTWLGAREKVLAQNVANANTPGYHSSDLRPLEFGKELDKVQGQGQGKLQLVVSNDAHLPESAAGSSSTGLIDNHDDGEIDGNTVSLEDEMIKVSQTANDYEMITNLYKKQLSMFKEAVGQSGSAG